MDDKVSRQFTCVHKGNCCENPTMLVNLTVGDMIRVSDITGMSITDLFGTAWFATPFGDGKTSLTYKVEPGLEMPCHFRRGGKCMIYRARPLNCRLFPYWILASLSYAEMKKGFHPSDLCCAFNCNPTLQEKEKYKRYVSALSKIMDKELLITDRILKELHLEKTIELPKSSTEFFNDFLSVGFSGVNLQQLKAEHQLMVARTLINQDEFLKLAEYIDAHKEELRKEIATLEEVEATGELLRAHDTQ